MILSELRTFIQARQRVTLGELTTHFDIDPEAMRGMLQKWLRKGVIVKMSANEACGTQCCQCDPLLTEIYQWQCDTEQSRNTNCRH
jgi:putative ferrous iron transport protein C